MKEKTVLKVLRKYYTGFFMAWGMFCWIPCPHKIWDEDARSECLAMLSLLGLFMGGLWYALALALIKLGIPAALSAGLLAVYPFAISGGTHLDGFMDSCDAMKSGRSLEEKQRILKDSHSGAFAIIGCAMIFVLSFAASLSLFPGTGAAGYDFLPLVLLPCVSRVVSSLDVMSHTPMGHSEYKGDFERQKKLLPKLVMTAILLAGTALFFCAAKAAGSVEYIHSGIAALLLEALAGVLFGAYARKSLGGMSGDIAGYEIVVMETAGLIALSAI